MKKAITVPGVSPVGPYSLACEAGGFVYTAGQIPYDFETKTFIQGDLDREIRQVFKNLGIVLTAAGLDFSHVVKTTAFLTDMGDFAALNAVYDEIFPPENRPARSCVAVCALPGNARVEIELIAARG